MLTTIIEYSNLVMYKTKCSGEDGGLGVGDGYDYLGFGDSDDGHERIRSGTRVGSATVTIILGSTTVMIDTRGFGRGLGLGE